MKLTITNYIKIIGQRVGVGNWLVSDVLETEIMYTFFCRQENSRHLRNVRLERDGFREGGEWKFKYWTPPGYGKSQVTLDWFADKDNAISSIGMELQKLI